MRLEPIGPTLADDLAPGGKFAAAGEALRQYDAKLDELLAAGAPPAATAALRAARAQLMSWVAAADAAEPRTWCVVPDEPAT